MSSDVDGAERRGVVEVAKAWLPPAVLSVARSVVGRIRSGGRPEWEYLPDHPLGERDDVGGWNVVAVAETQRRKWDAFRAAIEGAAALGIAHEAPLPFRQDIAAHNSIVAFGYVLARAARLLDRVSLLDWGGGVGHYGLFARSLLPEVEIEYHCKEVPVLCRTGRQLLPEATFHESDEEAFARRYDLVMASGALQFARDWRQVLGRMASSADRFVYVTRLPVVQRAASHGLLQRAHRYGYATEYVSWVLNRPELLEAAERHGLKLEREFLVEEGRPRVRGVPETAEYRGFLFRPLSAHG